MPSVTGSWRRHESNGSFVASKPLDVQLMPVGRGFTCDGFINRTSPRVRSLNFRFADENEAAGAADAARGV